MDRQQLSIWKKINSLQVDEILAHKWIESEKAGRDLGNDAVLDWISKYAAEFRAYWENKLSKEAY